MKRALWAIALFASSSFARAQTALSVEDGALWRVDLMTHESRLVYSFIPPDPHPFPEFHCWSLAASNTGDLRCLGTPAIIDIRPGAAQALAPLPHDAWDDISGFTFDAEGRLWWTGGRFIQQLDPATGAMISEKWLLLDIGCYAHALAAKGNRLFLFTECSSPHRLRLEEIDPWTAASLSAIDLTSLGFDVPRDAEFDAKGDLWLSDVLSPPFDPPPFGCFRYWRLRLSPLSAEMMSQECGYYGSGVRPLLNLAAIEGPGPIDVPATSPIGVAVFVLLMGAVAWRRLVVMRNPQ